MKYIKTLFYQIIVVCGIGTIGHMVHAQPTAEEMQFEQGLMEASQAIDEYVSTLSPEEQAEFNSAVEEVSEMIEGMSEEEFSQFLSEMIAAEEKDEEAVLTPEEILTPPVWKEIPVEEEPVVTPEQQRKIDNTLAMIDGITKEINLFITKVQSSPDLPGKIERWGKKGKIKEWPDKLTWADFKKQLENFVQKLYKVKEQDPKTKEYKYAGDLLEDETLFNNLAQLQVKLTKNVVKIEIPEFGLQKLSRKSKETAQRVVITLTESIYTLKIPEALDTLFEKYAPKAEKIRKEEEEAEKRAAEAAKRPRIPVRAVEAGAEEEFDYGFGPGYDSDFGASYTPTYEYPTTAGVRDRERRTDRGRRPSERAKPTRPTAAPEKDKKTTEAERLARLAQVPTDPESERLIGSITEKLKSIDEAINAQPILKNIRAHLTNAQEEVDTKLITGIIQLKRKVKKADGNIKALQLKTRNLNQTVRDKYKNELKSIVSEHQSTLESLAQSIKDINYEQLKPQIAPEKQWAYYKDETAQKIEQIRKQIPTPTTLPELQESIDGLLETVDTFVGKEEEKK